MATAAQRVVPDEIAHWIGGRAIGGGGAGLDKVNPATGERLCRLARGRVAEIGQAVAAARQAQPAWAALPGARRGEILHAVAAGLQGAREEMARTVALETGRSYTSALGETDGAVALGFFMAGEGQRLYGRTTTSGTVHRQAMTIREPLGVAGLIIAANTPIANVAWKVFPALVCGNAAVLKAAEDAPATAWLFGQIAQAQGLPAGVLNIVQGLGEEAGAALVTHPDVAVISFTGSTAVGREIARVAGERLARVSLELGGKNPFVICEDADEERAVKWALLSAFGNAGQRCSSASRLILLEACYERLRDRLVERTKALCVGPTDDDDLGPVINEAQLKAMVAALEDARRRGARVLVGGQRLTDAAHAKGFYMAPTLLEGVDPRDPLSTTELFGPIACLYRARDFEHALALANDSPYGLTACIHTRSVDRAMAFVRGVQAGVAVVNAGTFGSEPHMPFGGVKASGNGTREPGTEALDVYSSLKDVYLTTDPGAV
jgi:aldehyde dehydrogenase (NAD+)